MSDLETPRTPNRVGGKDLPPARNAGFRQVFDKFFGFYGNVLAAYSFTICFLASCFFLHSRGVFFPLWMDAFEVDRTSISLVVSVVLFTGAFVAPIFGYLIDRFPVKRIISGGLIWLAIGYSLMQVVDSYLAFFIVMLLFQSMGWECVGPLSQTKLMVNWFTRNRGMALGVAIMGISVAGIVMPRIAAGLSSTVGWQDAYLLYAGVAILVMLPLTLGMVKQEPADVGAWPDGDAEPLLAAPKVEAPEQNPRAELIATYREFLTSKAFWSVVITFGLMNGVYSAMATHMPTFLTREQGFTMVDASYVLGTAGAFAIIGKVVFGWLMDHADAKKTVLFAVVSYLISALVFMSASSFAVFIVGGGLFGLAFGGMVPVRSVLLSRMFGVRKFSRANGLFSFLLAPAMFWVLITGMIADSTGSYVTAFQIWAIAFALAGVVTLIIKLPNPADAVA